MADAKQARIHVEEFDVNREQSAIVTRSQFLPKSFVDKAVGCIASNEILLSNFLPDPAELLLFLSLVVYFAIQSYFVVQTTM